MLYTLNVPNNIVINPILKIVKKNSPFIAFLALYFLVILLINPTTNFPINDDWDNQLQIMAFSLGDYRIHSAIDASFILQPWIGFLWSFLFGYSFVSLRFLTIVFSVVLSYLLYILVKKDTSPLGTFIVLSVFMLNPIILNSSLSFMTEIYFLVGIVASYYFFNDYLEKDKVSSLVISGIILGFSILFRQLAIVSLVAYLITLFLKHKLSIKNTLIIILPVILGVIIWQLYPRAGLQEPFIYSLLEQKQISKRIKEMIFLIPLTGFIISPY